MTATIRPTPWELESLTDATGRLHDLLTSANWGDQHDGIQQGIDDGTAALVKLEATLNAAFDRAVINADTRRDGRNRANVAAMLTRPNEDQLERRAEHARDAKAESLATTGCAS